LKYRLLNFLACPYCKDKGFPLKLLVFEEKVYEERRPEVEKKPLCDLYCGLKRKFVKELEEEPPCEQCLKIEVVAGILHCPSCGRWYPIIDEIPRMLPDKYRKAREDLDFLERYRDKIPPEILYEGKPHNLKSGK